MAQTTTELILKTIVQGTEAAVSKVKGLTSSIGSASEKAKESSQFLAKWGAIAAGAVAAGAVLATKSFISFEDQLANVRKTTGASSEEIKQIGDQLLAYSQTTRSSIDELLTIGTIGGSLGIATKDIESFTEAVDKVNVALSEDFNGNVDSVTNAVSGLRLIFKDMQSDNIADDLLKIGNALNVAGNVGAATADVVADFAARIGGVAAPLGFTTGQVLGLSAAMQELQIEPERGAGAFTQIVQKMGQDIKGFAAIAGMSVASFKKLYNEDINGAFLAVAQGITSSGTSNTEYIDTLNKVGLDGIRTAEVIGKLGNNIQLVRERQGQLTDATKGTSSIMSEYDVKNNTAAASVLKLRNSVNTLAVNFVGTFADGLKGAIDGLTQLVQKVPELIAKFKDWYDNSILVRTGIVLISGAILGAFIPALVALATAAGTALIALAPFMITGALIAGMVAGIIWLYNNWDKVVKAIGDVIIWLHDTTQKFFGAIADWIKTKMSEIKSEITTKLEAIKTFFKNAWETIKAIPGNALEAVKKFVKEKLDAIAKFFGDAMVNIRKALDNGVGSVKDFFINLPTRIGEWIAQTPGILYNSGKKMIMEFVDGFTVWNPELNKAAHDTAQVIADHLEMHSPAKKGPLSTIDKWMPNGVKTLVSTLVSAGKSLIGPAALVAGYIEKTFNGINLSAAKKTIQDVSASIVAGSSSVVSSSDKLFSQIEDRLASFDARVSSLPEGLQQPFQQSADMFKSFSDSYQDTLKKLEDDFNDKAESIGSKIAQLNGDLQSLTDSYSGGQKDDNQKLAEQFVQQEKKIDQIKKDIVAKQKEITDNSSAIVKAGLDEQTVDQKAALTEKGAQLDEELRLLNKSLNLEKNALKSAHDYAIQLSDEISAARTRGRQSDFTNFVQDWTDRQTKDKEAYETKKNALLNEVSDLAKQRETILDVYGVSQNAIIKTFFEAKDIYLQNLNEQALGTKYYTELIGTYFDSVSTKIKRMGELPYLTGAAAQSLSSVQDELNFIKSDNRNLLNMPGSNLPAISAPSSTPIIASRAVNSSKPTQTINVVIDTFLGQDSFARKALDGFVGTLKKAISL